MTAGESGFLLLTSKLGDPHRHPLTVAQFRKLSQRVCGAERPKEDRELTVADLVELGYDRESAEHIVVLLSQTRLLEHYLSKGMRRDCCPIARVSPGYPLRIRKKLGLDSPGCFWVKGNVEILNRPKISLVGSRDLLPLNREFAYEAGKQAAKQGFVLVSGNARGADRTAQRACLEFGGQVISVVADELEKCPLRKNVLYMSEDGFDLPFTSVRALSRNRAIHSLADVTLVAQTTLNRGGSWDGTVRNLQNDWSSIFCFADERESTMRLLDMGASKITLEQLDDLGKLYGTKNQMIMEDLL